MIARLEKQTTKEKFISLVQNYLSKNTSSKRKFYAALNRVGINPYTELCEVELGRETLIRDNRHVHLYPARASRSSNSKQDEVVKTVSHSCILATINPKGNVSLLNLVGYAPFTKKLLENREEIEKYIAA